MEIKNTKFNGNPHYPKPGTQYIDRNLQSISKELWVDCMTLISWLIPFSASHQSEVR